MVPNVAGSNPVDRPFPYHGILLTTIDAIILGIVQGLTEFLPVSSSGHLHLVEHFLGLENLDHFILFDLACHLGTLLAVFFIFSKYIRELFGANKTRLQQILVATLPLFPLVLLMKPIKAAYADPSYLGVFFLMTAAILFLGIRFGKTVSEQDQTRHRWRDAFSIGLWQALAILPGVSRSGSTISGARILGWNASEAVSFSFLLAIPTILGGTFLELLNWYRHPEKVADLPYAHYLAGFFVSFIVGLAALKLLMFLAGRNKFSYFAWYCLFLGLATTAYFHL